MKKTILILSVLFSLGAMAQPSSVKKVKAEPSSITITTELKSDTLSVNIIVYDKEGYLKKLEGGGKQVRVVKYYQDNIKQPEMVSVNFYLDNWTLIPQSTIYDIKLRQ